VFEPEGPEKKRGAQARGLCYGAAERHMALSAARQLEGIVRWALDPLRRGLRDLAQRFQDQFIFDILPVLKAGDSCRAAHWRLPWGGFLLLTALRHRSLHRRSGLWFSHPTQACAMSCPSSHKSSLPRERILIEATSSALPV